MRSEESESHKQKANKTKHQRRDDIIDFVIERIRANHRKGQYDGTRVRESTNVSLAIELAADIVMTEAITPEAAAAAIRIQIISRLSVMIVGPGTMP